MFVVSSWALWPWMADYVFAGRSSGNSRCLIPQAKEWFITSSHNYSTNSQNPTLTAIWPIRIHHLSYHSFDRQKKRCARAMTPSPLSDCCALGHHIPSTSDAFQPHLVPTLSDQISFILIQT